MDEQQGMNPEIGEEAAMPADLCDRLTAAIPALRRFALSLSKDRDEAADLVQETCLRALAFWHQWRPGSNFESWLFQITRNLWIDRIRSRQSRERTVETVEQIGATFVDGQRIMEQRLTLGSIREILPRLPREQQDILLNVAVEGLSYKDASARLSTPIGTVMSRLSRARRALHSELGGRLTTGLILALLLPFLDREARADVKDLGAVNGDFEGPLADGLLMAPFLPLLDRDGRVGSAGSWITGMLGKALSAMAREMEGSAKGLQRADVAASLFFLLLVDLALTDQAGTRQLRDLFERAVGEPGLGPDDSRLALGDDGSLSEAAWSAPDGGDRLVGSGSPGGGHAQDGARLAAFTQDPDLQRPLATEAPPAMEQTAASLAGPNGRASADDPSRVTQSAGAPLADQAGDELLQAPAMEALARAGDLFGPDQPLVQAVSNAGIPPPGGLRATGPGDLAMAARGPVAEGKEFSASHESGVPTSAMAFVLGRRFELGDDDPQDHWAALLEDLLSDDDLDEGIFEVGEATLPAPGYWNVAGSEEPVTLGELLDMTGEDPVLADLIEQDGEAASRTASGFEPQRVEQVATQFEPESLDLQSVNEVQTDVS